MCGEATCEIVFATAHALGRWNLFALLRFGIAVRRGDSTCVAIFPAFVVRHYLFPLVQRIKFLHIPLVREGLSAFCASDFAFLYWWLSRGLIAVVVYLAGN